MAVVLLLGPAIGATAEAPVTDKSEIRGHVVGRDGLTAVVGVVVKVAHTGTKQVFSSAATGADGGYVVSAIPAGWYDLAVETTEGTFVSDALVKTTAGMGTQVSVALAPPAEEGEEGEEGEETDPAAEEEGEGQEGQGEGEEGEPSEPDQQTQPKKGPGFFKSPTGAAIIIVGSSLALATAAKNATDSGSKVTPPPPMTGSGN